MVDRFGTDKPIGSINFAEAEDFYGYLRLSKDNGGQGLAVSSSNQAAAIGFTLFNYAIDSEMLLRNPFKKLPRGTRKGNNSFVPERESLLVLENIIDTQQRLAFGLARWGGVRVPSELVPLRWSDIDWENNRFLVHSPKTERHEGGESRLVPIFPELAPLLDARFSEAAEGDEYLLPAYRARKESYAGNKLQLSLQRAGVDPWPRLWHIAYGLREKPS